MDLFDKLNERMGPLGGYMEQADWLLHVSQAGRRDQQPDESS